MSGRDARRARQRKAERAARLREEAGEALGKVFLAYLEASIAAERRLIARFREYLSLANLPTTNGGRYVENVVYWDGFGPPSARPANPDDHTWTRLPARWSAVDPARGPDQSRQLTVDMLTRADAYRAASDTRPYFEIISQQDLDQMRDDAERNTNDAIRRRLFG